MRYRPRPLVLCAVLAVASAASTVAQDDYHPLPRLPEGADTRDPRAYYELGIGQLIEQPDSAANSFWWASRLDPTWAQPLYARWVALHLSDPVRFRAYVDDDEEVIWQPEVQRIDSLAFRANQRNPFFFRRLAYLWMETYWRQKIIHVSVDGRSWFSDEQLNYVLDSLIRVDTATTTKAWLTYVNRQFASSLGHYRRLLSAEDDHVKRANIHAWRGHIFYLENQFDSAQVSFADAAEELRQRDEGELVRVYESKATIEYARGIALEASGRHAEAIEAHSTALLEDLSFYAAHERLARLALTTADTATALAECELAVESDPTQVLPYLFLGAIQYQTGRDELAAGSLRRAIELEPYYAEPQYVLGMVLDRMGDRAGAVAAYRTFLGLARATDERRPTVSQRLEQISEEPP